MRSWLNRIANLLCLVCFLMLGIGIAIEAATANLLFENYISTFTGYVIILAVVASLSRPSRRAGKPHTALDGGRTVHVIRAPVVRPGQ